jgi:hypothetical protein
MLPVVCHRDLCNRFFPSPANLSAASAIRRGVKVGMARIEARSHKVIHMRFSVGRSIYGAVEDVLDVCWSDFVSFMSDAAQVSRDPDDKDDSWWLMASLPMAGAQQRRLEDMDSVGAWCGLDVDHGNLSLSDIRLALFGSAYLAYTTSNSRPDAQRWRIVILLDRELSVGEYARVWLWFSHKFPDADKACRNANRIFYIPSLWHGADNVMHHSDGHRANVDSILAMVPAAPVIPAAVLAGQLKRAPDNTQIIGHHLITTAQSAPAGMRFFRLMCSAAKRFRLMGWQLRTSDLEHAALAASAVFAPGKPRPNSHREAQRAIRWAERNCQPMSALEKMRSRILWERSRGR